ncbi:hypothetical protein JCM8097_003821 [Rhodosporidiobolus ruineniae]
MKRQRPPPAPASPSTPDDLDTLVHSLANGTTPCPPAYSTTSNLLALASPPSTPTPFPLFPSDPLTHARPAPPLEITLTHLSSPVSSAVPRVQVRLQIPSSSTSTAESRITHLSFSPDGEQLLAVSSSPSTGGDYLTLFDHRSPSLDEGWEAVLHEPVGRFAPPTGMDARGVKAGEKRVLSVRWVGEPRRWYPSPTFPDAAREAAKKPLYCAPPRSAPLSGTAFVAVLSSDELLFLHLPRQTPLLPLALLLPLSPPLSSPSSSPSLARSAAPLAPTPLPSAAPALFALPSGLPGIVDPSLVLPLPPPGALPVGMEASPQATVDALVTSLVTSGVPPAAAPATSSAAALQAELDAASYSSSALPAAVSTRVRKAAIGAARSRGTAEGGETVFVVARWRGGGGRVARATTTGGRAKRVKREAVTGKGAKEEEKPKEEKAMNLDDDFSLFADFTSLDEAFGSSAPPPLAAAPPADAAPPVEEEGEEDDEWDPAEEVGREKWRVELTEVRVEMCPTYAKMEEGMERGEGRPRLSIRPQPPLYLVPTPSPSPSSSSSNPREAPSDPLLTHLTFLGDVALPHPLQTLSSLSSGPGLAQDGSEPAVDLCLLAVLAHPTTAAGGGGGWSSTLSCYPLSQAAAGYALSDAFHTLEGRRLDAPNVVADEISWAGRHAASASVGGGGGLVSAVEIRPGGGEWGSCVVAVAEAGEGGEGVRTRLVALSSSTLEPLLSSSGDEKLVNGNGMEHDAEEDDGKKEKDDGEGEYWLPGSQLYHSLAFSPNGGLVCALPFSPSLSSSSSVAPSKPVLASPPLGLSSTPPLTALALRLAVALARQSSASDLSGRLVTLKPDDLKTVVAETGRVLGRMIGTGGEEGEIEGSALGWELLGVVSGLYRAIPTLRPLSTTANRLLSLSALVRAFQRANAPLRSAPQVWRCEDDCVWPLVGYVGWFVGEWWEGVMASVRGAAVREEKKPAGGEGAAEKDDALFHFLHPLSLSLLATAVQSILFFRTFLYASSALQSAAGTGTGASEAVELAKVVVGEAVDGFEGGRGLEKVKEVVERIRADVVGSGPATKHSPPLLLSLTLPSSLEAQATAARQILLEAFPGPSSPSSSDGAESLPTPPPEGRVEEGWDVVRRALLPPTSSSSSLSFAAPPPQCLRCGRKTHAATSYVPDPAAGVEGGAGGQGKWRRFEEGWEGRCVCGGNWVRGRA